MNVQNLKVSNFKSPRSGNSVANQFLVSYREKRDDGQFNRVEVFQSYGSVIARVTTIPKVDGYVNRLVELDENTWDYSRTTGKYRNEFLGEGVAETRKKIESGEYSVVNLNS